MAVIATESQRFSNVVKYELFPEFAHCREVLTYNGVAKDFKIGDLVAAAGAVPATAGDIVGIVVKDVSAAASTNTPVLVLARGAAGVSVAGLNLGLLTEANVTAALLAKGIKVLQTV